MKEYRMYVRETSESVHVKGWKSGELAALGDSGNWGFPQVALGKIADWSERFGPPTRECVPVLFVFLLAECRPP